MSAPSASPIRTRSPRRARATTSSPSWSHFDLTFRTRRLRFVARRITETTETMEAPREEQEEVLRILHAAIARYRAREPEQADEAARRAFAAAAEDPAAALAALGAMLGLEALDGETDEALSAALLTLPKADRRALILAYLGYPYYDIATLPLLQGEGLDEFDPIKVDRISPNDAVAIRKGGPHATLKGLQFNSFGAFFSRAYRENDYLWGRLHGADRLIDIVNSAVPEEQAPRPRHDRRAEARRLPRHPRRGERPADQDRRPVRGAGAGDRLSTVIPRKRNHLVFSGGQESSASRNDEAWLLDARAPIFHESGAMQFLKTLFWVVFAVVMVLFARDNWQVVHVNLWAGLIADVKLPMLVLFAFLLGFLPTFIVYRARIWSLRRRLETQGPATTARRRSRSPCRRRSAPARRRAASPSGRPTRARRPTPRPGRRA